MHTTCSSTELHVLFHWFANKNPIQVLHHHQICAQMGTYVARIEIAFRHYTTFFYFLLFHRFFTLVKLIVDGHT